MTQLASLVLVCVLIVIGAMQLQPAESAAPEVEAPPRTVWRPLTDGPGISVAAPAAASIATATFNVRYTGFPANVQASFDYAINILRSQYTSPVPVTIDAHWTALDSGILGEGGSQLSLRDFEGAPQAGTFYPIPLANKLAGRDLCPENGSCGESDDIYIAFNSSFSSWYFGTDGATPASRYDFVTVVIYEVTHGLGFFGSANVSGSTGCWGRRLASCSGTGNFPYVYDRFIVNGSGQSIINTSLFGNPSTALGTQLTSGNLYWTGANGTAANSGNRPKIYAPRPWEGGSSYSHLDQGSVSTANALMQPGLRNGTAIHDIGPIVRGMMTDMGWSFGNLPPVAASVQVTNVFMKRN